MTQSSLFDEDAVYVEPEIIDIVGARRERDRAIDRVDQASDDIWKRAADLAIRSVAYTRLDFTTDDVWVALHEMAVESPTEPRALGAAMRRAQRAGLIEPTNRVEQSARPVCHAAPKRVWQSLVHDAR